jgi:two-component SAPR family response regulator
MKIRTTKKKMIALWLLLCFRLPVAFPQASQYGLKFHAYSYEPEMRTGLDLSPDDFFSFPEGFAVSFDVKFEFKEAHTYGYVFRVGDKNGHKIDFVLGDKNVSFSSSIGNIVFVKTFDEVELLPEQWMTIRLEVNIKKSELCIRIGNVARRWITPEVKNFNKVRIVFGKNNYPETQAVDVPEMTIRELKIENRTTTLYRWKLAKYAADGVYDELKNRFAKCENPDWVLTQNRIWKKESSFTCTGNPYITYNPDENIIAIADRRLFYRFSLNGNQLTTQPLTNQLSYTQYANQLIYNPADANYYTYNLVKEGEGQEFAAFDQTTGAWDKTTPHTNYSDYWHHNRYFSTKHNRLYLFGGYGHHKYRQDVFTYDVSNRRWERQMLTGDSIEPRYLSGLGVIDDHRLLRFGGYGSKSGHQELSPQHYYDACLIDLQTMTAKKIWTMETPPENFVVSNSLVVDTANNCFYALCYPFTKFNTAVLLHKFSLTQPVYEALADTIPLGFKDTWSFVDLFMDRTNHRLIAVTSSPLETDSLAAVSIYSLSCPPIGEADLYQSVKPDGKASATLFVILTGCFLLTAMMLVLFRKKRQTDAVKPEETIAETVAVTENISGISTIKPVRKQFISLFGGFQVIDKNGVDLTTEFKPLVKNLFLLILLSTIKNGKGISFRKLKEILWFDMTEESANNNRGVAMSKIRQIMKQVGNIRFLKKGVYWMVEFGDDIRCDYYEALVLMQTIKESTDLNTGDLKKLLAIVSEGELLPNMQIDWADTFKSDFSNDFVDLLVPLLDREETQFSDSLYIDLANAIFIHDPLNEDALRLKCSILVKMGKNGLAKNAYTAFIKEYSAWFAVDYKYSFDQLISYRD